MKNGPAAYPPRSASIQASVCLWAMSIIGNAAAGQVIVSASPQPMLITDAIPVKVIGLWDIRVCNDGAEAVKLPAERVYMAIPPEIRLLSASSARIVLATRQAKNKKAIAATLVRYGITIGTTVTASGIVSASKTVIGYLALSGELARQTERELSAHIPSVLPFTENLLDGIVLLGPKGAPDACATRTAFAAKMRNPNPVSVTIQP